MAYWNQHQLPNRYIPLTIGARRVVIAISILTVIAFAPTCLAQENPKQPSLQGSEPALKASPTLSPSYTATPEELDAWIGQLASPVFNIREQAVRQLTRCDASAVHRLREAAVTSDDVEVKSRCLAIAEAIFEQDVGKRVKEFIRDPDPEMTHGFDGWKSFSEIVGKNRAAKQIFADLIASDPNHSISKSTAESDNAALLQRDATAIFNKFRSRRNLELSDSVSLLYRTIRLNGQVPEGVNQVTTQLLRLDPLTVEISRPPLRATLQKLVGSWMKVSQADPISLMIISIDHEIPEGIEVARRTLQNQDCEPILYRMAISTLMRFGNRDDIQLLSPWFSKTKLMDKEFAVQVRAPIPVPNAVPDQEQPNLELGPSLMVQQAMELQWFEQRYQDMALAAAAHLLKREDIRDLFPRIQSHPKTVFRADSIALPKGDEDARQRVIDALAKEISSLELK